MVFQKLEKNEFDEYMKEAIIKIAKEYAKGGIVEEKDSLKTSEKIFKDTLPEGLDTKNHFLNMIVNDNGEKIGIIWYGNRSESEVFIYDFIINEPYQGKGYGKEAMKHLEDLIKEKGIKKISLHVFGHNKIARALYEKMGYEPFSIHMAKEI